MSYTILYVEDENAIIDLVNDVLAHPEVKLVTAYNGNDGLAKARAVKPDLVLLDVMMPDRSGWSVFEEIRSDDVLRNVPVIILTAQMHRYHIKKQFENSPIDAYITKPFDAGAVRQEIETMLGVKIWPSPVSGYVLPKKRSVSVLAHALGNARPRRRATQPSRWKVSRQKLPRPTHSLAKDTPHAPTGQAGAPRNARSD
jgi:DNA-binding response OmpR family regulator